jgi:phosphoglycerate dehydrogenase-like enzyme
VTATLHVVSLVPLREEDGNRIEAVDPSVRLTMAAGWFDGEIRDAWGDYTADSYLRPGSDGYGTRAERDRLLADADVVLGGFPMPVDLRARAPRLRWVHQTPAGASNLRRCDLWGSDVTVTTSRGLGNTLAIAEYVVASFLHFARELHRAGDDRHHGRFRRFDYRPTLVAGETACVIGAGGIGRDVGRLCAGLGMQVVGTRRSPTGALPEGFAEITGPDRLLDLLARSRFVAVCCQWTPETEGLIGAEAFAAMPDDAVVVNVARGEIVDEGALVANLDRLRGVALDVYVGEFDRPPPDELWSHPKVLITPHVSGGAQQRSDRPVNLFCQNLAALVAGRPLENVIDWNRGY